MRNERNLGRAVQEMFHTGLLCLFILHHAGKALGQMPFSTHTARIGSDVLIPCKFAVEATLPHDRTFLICWDFQGKEILRYYNGTLQASDPRVSLHTDGVRAGVADLRLSQVSIPDGGLYKCSVAYTSETREQEIRLDIQAPPQILITNNVVVINEESVLRSSITGFYPVDIDITWLRDGELLSRVTVEKPQRNLDGTYSTSSSVTITPTEEDRKRTFSCRVQHQSLREPLHERLLLVYGGAMDASTITTIVVAVSAFVAIGLGMAIFGFIRWYQRDEKRASPRQLVPAEGSSQSVDGGARQNGQAESGGLCSQEDMAETREAEEEIAGPSGVGLQSPPVMSEIRIPLLVAGTEAKLECKISGYYYYPSDLKVNWLRRRPGKTEFDEVSPSSKFTIPNMEITQEADHTYTCTASLIVAVSAVTEHGSEYICRVMHPALVTPLEKRTGELRVAATENAAATTEKREKRESPGVSNTGICIDKSSKPAEHGNEGTAIQGGQQGVKELRQMFERKE